MTRARARIRRGRAEGAEVTEGWWGEGWEEDEECRMQMCGREERHDGRKYNKLLFGERGQEWTHERGS